MSTLLYRIGKTAYQRSWYVIGAWIVVLAVIGTALYAGTVRVSSDIRIDGTPAQKVLDELAVRMPALSGGQASVVFQAPAGERVDSPANASTIGAAVGDVYGIHHVIDPRALATTQGAQASAEASTGASAAAGGTQPGPLRVDGRPVAGVVVSADGRVALFQVQFDRQTFELPAGTVDGVVTAARHAAQGTGITVLSAAMLGIPQVLGVDEVAGLGVAAIVLLITLGSLVAAGLPLLTAFTGVLVGVGGAYALSSVIELNSAAAVLALMLGLAVGIDYALFIVNRQRRLMLGQGLGAHEAAGRAVGTAGSAVFFAGLTVIIALVALLVVNITLLTTMALIAAATVAIAVLVALTLLPALMGLVGERVCTPGARSRHDQRAASRHGAIAAERWARLVVRHHYLAIGTVVIVLGVMALPVVGMHLGLPSGKSYNTDTAQRQSYDAIADSLGDGYNGPLLVVASSTREGVAIGQDSVGRLIGALSATPGVSAVMVSGASASGDIAVITVIPDTGPTNSATENLVRTVRAAAPTYARDLGVSVGVTGITAMAIDVSQRLSDVLPIYLSLVLGLSLIVLMLVFRSIIVPVKATAGFLLSILATFGVTTAVFQWGWLRDYLGFDATTPVLSFLPIIATGVLYGLAMDYEVFLVSSIRESYVHGHHGTETVVQGFRQASRVVAGAAIIMTAVFAGFIFNHDPMIKQIGFALAFGVLIDAFVVRMTLVPAVMAMVGDKAWWLPRWLDRLVPALDVEGDKLITTLRAAERRHDDVTDLGLSTGQGAIGESRPPANTQNTPV